MSRTKKSRSGTSSSEVIVVRNRSQSDVDGRLRKRIKNRKGLKTGSRNAETKEQNKQGNGQQRDPRLGSKKKIPLIVEAPKKLSKADRRISAEKELEMLENDAQLNVLLDRLEEGEKLGVGLQKYVDEKLNRIEALMKQLGIYEVDADLEDEEYEDEAASVAPSAKKVGKKSSSDEDLLSQFEDIDLDQFKG